MARGDHRVCGESLVDQPKPQRLGAIDQPIAQRKTAGGMRRQLGPHDADRRPRIWQPQFDLRQSVPTFQRRDPQIGAQRED